MVLSLVLALAAACVTHKPSPIEYAFEHAPPVAPSAPVALPGAGTPSAAAAAAAAEATPTYGAGAERLSIEVPAPPFTDGIYPCSDCHAGEPTNFTRRAFPDDHKDIVFEHDAQHRWCLDCHNPDDRDKLRLASGVLVPFEQSYRLCGQCHGDKYRDWRLGIHGRRSGQWNGAKTYLLCVHCHSPHSPKFKPLEPKPAPWRPGTRGAP